MGACTSFFWKLFVSYDEHTTLLAKVPTDTYYGSNNLIGQHHGMGICHFANGDTYNGHWKYGKKHGYGIYTSNGTSIEGYFKEDTFIGNRKRNKLFQDVTKAKTIEENSPLPAKNTSRKQYDPCSRYNNKTKEEKNRKQIKKEREEKHQKLYESMRDKYNCNT